MNHVDDDLFYEISVGDKTIYDIKTTQKSPYLCAVIIFSDDAFVEAIQSGISLPTKRGDIYDVVKNAYYLNRTKSIQVLKPLVTKELLSSILNEEIKNFDQTFSWLEFMDGDKNYIKRLLDNGAILDKENQIALSNATNKFTACAQRLNRLILKIDF
jgi:hypothetical protein